MIGGMNGLKETKDIAAGKFAESWLAKQVDKVEFASKNYDAPIVKEVGEPIKNKVDGLAREKRSKRRIREEIP